MSKTQAIAVGVCLILWAAACQRDDSDSSRRFGTTLDELLLEDARTCSSGFTYPQSLIDGLGKQLVEELICMDGTILEFYEPCKEVGCIWADGPQPLAMRPEVIDALDEAATSRSDFITINAGYRDVAMQYYSRWRTENCDPNFLAAIPGQSNHQGGRAIDVKSYTYWRNTLLSHGFVHPIPDDEPHYELEGDAQFRAESEDLKTLSILAFQRLWNRNNAGVPLDEDGVYGAATKAALGGSPVEGFPIGACDPGVADPAPDAGPADGGTADGGTADAGADFDAGPDDVHDPDGGRDAGEDDASSVSDVGVVDAPNPVDAGTAPVDSGGQGPDAGGSDEGLVVQRFATVPPEGLGDEGCHVVVSQNENPLVWFGLVLVVAMRRRRRSG